MNKTTIAMLGASVLIAAPLAAQAQVQTPGFYGSIQGMYWVDSGNDHATEVLVIGIGTFAVAPDDGWGANGKLGYRFSTMPIDIAVGLAHSWLPNGKAQTLGAFTAKEKAHYSAADIELGYTFAFAGGGLRPFVGARAADWRHTTNYGNAFVRHVDTEVIGPRVGFDGAVAIAPSFSLFGGASAAALFGDTKGKWPVQITPTPGLSRNRTVWNFEGQAGVAWEIAPLVSLSAGYRVEVWDGVTDRNLTGLGAAGLASPKSQDRLLHGPFVRLSYNIGVPGAAPVAMAPPSQPPVLAKTYIVFFDWDRSTLTPDALKTIADAAAASKTGGVQRVNVTGHADRSGSDQYNMALSLRRAGAVKDQLVRNGVPANQIVVVGRGESQPLVPTADGVREPQNRRVEIVLN